jgi:hypothetical protein
MRLVNSVVSFTRECLHVLPDDEDINFEDSTMGLVRSESSAFCLLLGELSLVPPQLDRSAACCCPSGDSVLSLSTCSLPLLTG